MDPEDKSQPSPFDCDANEARLGALELAVQSLLVNDFSRADDPVARADLALTRARRQLHRIESQDGNASPQTLAATKACFLEMLEIARQSIAEVERYTSIATNRDEPGARRPATSGLAEPGNGPAARMAD